MRARGREWEREEGLVDVGVGCARDVTAARNLGCVDCDLLEEGAVAEGGARPQNGDMLPSLVSFEEPPPPKRVLR